MARKGKKSHHQQAGKKKHPQHQNKASGASQEENDELVASTSSSSSSSEVNDFADDDLTTQTNSHDESSSSTTTTATTTKPLPYSPLYPTNHLKPSTSFSAKSHTLVVTTDSPFVPFFDLVDIATDYLLPDMDFKGHVWRFFRERMLRAEPYWVHISALSTKLSKEGCGPQAIFEPDRRSSGELGRQIVGANMLQTVFEKIFSLEEHQQHCFQLYAIAFCRHYNLPGFEVKEYRKGEGRKAKLAEEQLTKELNLFRAMGYYLPRRVMELIGAELVADEKLRSLIGKSVSQGGGGGGSQPGRRGHSRGSKLSVDDVWLVCTPDQVQSLVKAASVGFKLDQVSYKAAVKKWVQIIPQAALAGDSPLLMTLPTRNLVEDQNEDEHLEKYMAKALAGDNSQPVLRPEEKWTTQVKGNLPGTKKDDNKDGKEDDDDEGAEGAGPVPTFDGLDPLTDPTFAAFAESYRVWLNQQPGYNSQMPVINRSPYDQNVFARRLNNAAAEQRAAGSASNASHARPVENNATRPVQNTAQPVQNAALSVQNNATRPVQNADRPVQNTARPVQNTARPVQNTSEPVQNNATRTVENTAQPVQNTARPVENKNADKDAKTQNDKESEEQKNKNQKGTDQSNKNDTGKKKEEIKVSVAAVSTLNGAQAAEIGVASTSKTIESKEAPTTTVADPKTAQPKVATPPQPKPQLNKQPKPKTAHPSPPVEKSSDLLKQVMDKCQYDPSKYDFLEGSTGKCIAIPKELSINSYKKFKESTASTSSSSSSKSPAASISGTPSNSSIISALQSMAASTSGIFIMNPDASPSGSSFNAPVASTSNISFLNPVASTSGLSPKAPIASTSKSAKTTTSSTLTAKPASTASTAATSKAPAKVEAATSVVSKMPKSIQAAQTVSHISSTSASARPSTSTAKMPTSTATVQTKDPSKTSSNNSQNTAIANAKQPIASTSSKAPKAKPSPSDKMNQKTLEANFRQWRNARYRYATQKSDSSSDEEDEEESANESQDSATSAFLAMEGSKHQRMIDFYRFLRQEMPTIPNVYGEPTNLWAVIFAVIRFVSAYYSGNTSFEMRCILQELCIGELDRDSTLKEIDLLLQRDRDEAKLTGVKWNSPLSEEEAKQELLELMGDIPLMQVKEKGLKKKPERQENPKAFPGPYAMFTFEGLPVKF